MPPTTVAETIVSLIVGHLAAEAPPPPGVEPSAAPPFRAWLAPEGVPTDDGRFMLPGSLSWRDPPLPLMFSDRTLPGHLLAHYVGSLVDLDRREVDGVSWVTAVADYDTDPEGVEAARNAAEGRVTGISIDLAIVRARAREGDAHIKEEAVRLGIEAGRITLGAITAAEEEDWPEGVWLVVEEGIIVGATQLPMPAFGEARVEPDALTAAATPFVDLPLSERERAWDADAALGRVRTWASRDGGDAEAMNWSRYRRAFFWYDADDPEAFGAYKLPFADVIDGTLTAVFRGVSAAAGVLRGGRGGVDIPAGDRVAVNAHVCRYYAKARRVYEDDGIECPLEQAALLAADSGWFDDPGLTVPTRAKRGAGGRLAGHGAAWGACLVGRHPCVPPPRSRTGYALAAREAGPGGPAVPIYWRDAPDRQRHAPPALHWWEAIDWYERNCEVAGLAAVGEDEHGIWCSGGCGPQLEGRHLSGDWRPHPVGQRAGYELVGWSIVDRAGFPIAEAIAAADAGLAILGAGEVCDCGEDEEDPLRVEVRALAERLEGAIAYATGEYERFGARQRADAALRRLTGTVGVDGQ